MLNELKIAETRHFQDKIKIEPFKNAYNKIYNYVYTQLKENPFFGKNIKKLKGDYKELYRYRIGDFRLFYLIYEDKRLVIMVDIDQRKDSY
ncbi:MAG TPA: type II toxin-antitoxin system RelE/ParE family toxin [bacterium]